MFTRGQQPKTLLKQLIIVAALLVMNGCASNGPPPPTLTWPPAPRPPRIEYTRSIYGSQSLPRGFFAKFKDFFFGKSPDMALGKPYGLTYDGKSTLYIIDTAKKGLMTLNLDNGQIGFIESLGPYGRLIEPVNVIIDEQRNIYVADTGLKKIVVFDRDGVFSHFIGEGILASPVGLVFGPREEQLFVTDSAQHDVKIFSPAGELIGGFGKRGDQAGEFYHPLGITINQMDQVLVVDSFHFAVQAFDLTGNYLFSFGSTTKGLGSLARPRGITTDSENLIYVTDALRNNVQIFDPQGSRLLSFGAMGLGPGQFRLPAGICFTADDRIFVVDSINKRIQEFKYVARGQESSS